MDEEEFVGTGEVVRIEKTEEGTDVARLCLFVCIGNLQNVVITIFFELFAIVILAGV